LSALIFITVSSFPNADLSARLARVHTISIYHYIIEKGTCQSPDTGEKSHVFLCPLAHFGHMLKKSEKNSEKSKEIFKNLLTIAI